MEDRGQYMCQVNTDPMKMQVSLTMLPRLLRIWIAANDWNYDLSITLLLWRELPDCIFGGSDSAGYNLRGNIRRYDGAGGKLSEISVQSEGFPKAENHMVSE